MQNFDTLTGLVLSYQFLQIVFENLRSSRKSVYTREESFRRLLRRGRLSQSTGYTMVEKFSGQRSTIPTFFDQYSMVRVLL